MNALVAYFSASGTTAKAAKVLAKAADADLYEIKPAIPYTRADLNWMDKGSRSSVEMSDKHSRPALADTDAPIAGHDVIFLTGKTIILFATSGGSGLGKSAVSLRASVPGARIVDGRLLNGRLNADELKTWVSGLKL